MIRYKNHKVAVDLKIIPDFEETINDLSEDILKYLNMCFKDFLVEFRMPEIVFDDSCPKSRNYDGNLSAFEVRDALISLVSDYQEIRCNLKENIQILNEAEQEGSILDRLFNVRRKITDIFFNPFSDPYEKEFAKKAGSIIAGLKTENATINSLLGCYDSNTNKIVLYYKSIGYNPSDLDFPESFIAKVAITLAHEIFHAFHYAFASNTFCSTNYYSKVVKEASADFFSFLYCLYSDNPKFTHEALLRHDEWKTWFISQWPYAKALFYIRLKGRMIIDDRNKVGTFEEYVENGSVDKLIKVTNISKNSMEKAYQVLVYDELDVDVSSYIIPFVPIVEFSIIHHPGTWRNNIPPYRYTVKLRGYKIEEIHYKDNRNNSPEAYRITLKGSSDLVKKFFDVVNQIFWNKNYAAQTFDAESWEITLTYKNHDVKTVYGTGRTPSGTIELNDWFQEIYKEAGYHETPYLI